MLEGEDREAGRATGAHGYGIAEQQEEKKLPPGGGIRKIKKTLWDLVRFDPIERTRRIVVVFDGLGLAKGRRYLGGSRDFSQQ